MSPTPSYYRARADECERLVAKALSPDTREMMTYLAILRWRGLAEQDETQKTSLQPKRRTLAALRDQ
jgi:hypothetical protein